MDTNTNTEVEGKVFLLTSSSLVHTPGFIRWLVKGLAIDAKGTKQARKMLKEIYPNLTELAVDNIFAGRYTVDREQETVEVVG